MDKHCGTDNKLKNGVMQLLQKEWDEKGYTGDNLPTAIEFEAIVEKNKAIYQFEQGKAKPVKAVAPKPVSDTGTGGKVSATTGKLRPCATLDEAADDLRKGIR